MFSKMNVGRILTAEVGDTIESQTFKGRVVSIEHMRDNGGNPQIMMFVEPSGTDKQRKQPLMPEGYELKDGAKGHGLYHKSTFLGAPLEVVAEVLYPNGDRGLLLRWSLEYADANHNKRLEHGTFFIHTDILKEDSRYLLGRLQQGGYTLPAKMVDAAPELLRNYLVKSEPAQKAISISDLREHAARNGWEIPGPGSKG